MRLRARPGRIGHHDAMLPTIPESTKASLASGSASASGGPVAWPYLGQTGAVKCCRLQHRHSPLGLTQATLSGVPS